MIKTMLLLVLYPVAVFAQISANQYFEGIYAKYQNIEDMQATINFTFKGD